jgi:hypothetical protein
VVAVRMVLRADGVRQLLRGCHVGGQDDAVSRIFNGQRCRLREAICSTVSLFALSYSWAAVFFVMYAIEFLCLSAARLMVLDRMSDFAAGQDEGTRKRWAAGGRVVMAVVVLGNAVGLAANVAAAVHAQRAAEAASTASALFAANSTQAARESVSLSQTEAALSVSIAAVQSFCEVAVLLLIVAAFVVAGVVCARVVSSRLRAVDAVCFCCSGQGAEAADCGYDRGCFRCFCRALRAVHHDSPSPVSCKMEQRDVPE